MKTIREKVFETNSSSTHSVVIQKKNGISPINSDGILFTSRLSRYAIETQDGNGYVLNCGTKDLKAALVANWLCSVFDYKDWEDSGNLEDVLKYLSSKLVYTEITSPKYSQFYPDSDGSNNIKLSNYKDLDVLIEQILDDDVEFIETREEW